MYGVYSKTLSGRQHWKLSTHIYFTKMQPKSKLKTCSKQFYIYSIYKLYKLNTYYIYYTQTI